MCNFDGTKCNTTKIDKLDTWQVDLSGGITFKAVKHDGITGLDLQVFWANGETMDNIDELTLQPADMQRLADLFATVAKVLSK